MSNVLKGEWIDHDGNVMPVDGKIFVVVEHGDGWVSERPYRARAWRWVGTAGHCGFDAREKTPREQAMLDGEELIIDVANSLDRIAAALETIASRGASL